MQEFITLHLTGAFCAPIDHALERNVRRLLDRGARRIILNVAAVSDLDAAGLGELVRVFNLASDGGGMVRTVGAVGRTRTLLDRAGLLPVLDSDSSAAALVGPLDCAQELKR